jgi:hypothetical protein
LYHTPNIIRMVKSRIMKWVRLVESIEHKINADKGFGGINCREEVSWRT